MGRHFADGSCCNGDMSHGSNDTAGFVQMAPSATDCPRHRAGIWCPCDSCIDQRGEREITERAIHAAQSPARPCPGTWPQDGNPVRPLHCPGCAPAPSLTEEERAFLDELRKSLPPPRFAPMLHRMFAIIDRLTGGA
jgi:hypothetical protein